MIFLIYQPFNMLVFPCCPADAVTEVKEAVHYISPFKGGETCVREVIEKVMKLNGHWEYSEHVRLQVSSFQSTVISHQSKAP